MDELYTRLTAIFTNDINKVIISKPSSGNERYMKIVLSKRNGVYQQSSHTEKQVFHENLSVDMLLSRCYELINGHYKQVNAMSGEIEYMLLISKKGGIAYKEKRLTAPPRVDESGHNRRKNYLIRESAEVKPLIDMGVFTSEGKVFNSMYDKYRQINRFVEIIDDEISSSGLESVNVIDFGCGKSYLTFVVYYYLTAIRGIKANIIGLDLKEEVIKNCNEAARKYGYDGLHFKLGDINGYEAPFDVDIVISLHACDTATDYALYNAVRWNAKYIFSVPCCQHELNGQIKSDSLLILTRYGIIKERFSSLATDSIRANLLEYMGYRTQLLEFIDFEHTPKNILIRAVKKTSNPSSARGIYLAEVEALIKEFNFIPTLYRLFTQKEQDKSENA